VSLPGGAECSVSSTALVVPQKMKLVAGVDAAGNILRSAVAAASGAAAAAGERLKGLLPGSQESQQLPSIDIPESVGQGAIVAGKSCHRIML